MRTVVLALALALATAACKGDAQKCEQAARNYATLTFWKGANAEIEKAPPAQRDALRKKKLSAFTNELEANIDFYVQQCQSANNDDQVDCMIAAKTAEDVAKCAEPAESN
ncbi:MAG TPA: hypothetical protein VFQ53_16710 [Kofleriaceae bacterium]|nr:hypothetical protein [Kofleriaceae bacterium]